MAVAVTRRRVRSMRGPGIGPGEPIEVTTRTVAFTFVELTVRGMAAQADIARVAMDQQVRIPFRSAGNLGAVLAVVHGVAPVAGSDTTIVECPRLTARQGEGKQDKWKESQKPHIKSSDDVDPHHSALPWCLAAFLWGPRSPNPANPSGHPSTFPW